jgi:hypothetical protein
VPGVQSSQPTPGLLAPGSFTVVEGPDGSLEYTVHDPHILPNEDEEDKDDNDEEEEEEEDGEKTDDGRPAAVRGEARGLG